MKQQNGLADEKIVELYWERSETAINETAAKYGGYCHSIAYNVLHDSWEAEESVNDTYLDAWNSMPPHRPAILSAFLGKITRRISIDKWRKKNAEKRGGSEMPAVLGELEECVADGTDVEKTIEQKEMARVIEEFLSLLPVTERRVFLCRYWYMEPIEEIARGFGFTKSKAASMLHRTRGKLRRKLESEGYL